MTMQLVSTVTVGAGGAASIEFTSIPQTGTDLLLLLSGRSSTGGGLVSTSMQFNNVSSIIYTTRLLYGDGSAPGNNSYANVSQAYPGYVTAASVSASTFGNMSIYIPNYNSSANKSMSAQSVTENSGVAYVSRHAMSWASTAAITSIKLYPGAGNFEQYSSATLYTITKGSGGATVS